MNIKYEITYNNYTHKVNVDEPNECPRCKHSLKPTILHKQLVLDNNSELSLYVMYLCTHCYEPFICKFSNLAKDEKFSSTKLFSSSEMISIDPKSFEKKTFDGCIHSLSPDFVTIYNQALEAEHLELDQISGIGYRKSLEFLIKDFLIKHQGIDASKVKPTALGNCINTMIDNPQLKIVASRATWLGNDQTHYEQKYTDNDINDLKRLINLSVHWISMIYLTEEAESIEKK